MSSEPYSNVPGSGPRSSERRSLIIGSVIGVVILALLASLVIRSFSSDERLLVLQPDGGAEVDSGDRVRVTGTVQDFELEPGGEGAEADGADGANAVSATAIEQVGDDVPGGTVDLTDLRDDPTQEGEDVTLVGEVDEVFGDEFLTLEESD